MSRNKVSRDLSRRTLAEALWLARKESGRTVEEEAAERGLGKGRYRATELGRLPALAAALAALAAFRSPSFPLLLRLARRRAGTGLDAFARELGLSRPAVLAAERRGDPRVARYWRDRGFRFPAGG